MEDQNHYREDIRAIREIMQRSTRFISLSGLSGIVAGLVALIAAFLAWRIDPDLFRSIPLPAVGTSPAALGQLVALSIATLLIAISGAFVFTLRSARKNREYIWNVHFRQLLVQLAIPLLTGGVICLYLAFAGLINLVSPMMLIFYGLALIGASKYTLKDIFGLGVLEIGLGLTGLFLPAYGLWLWATGFGLFHIVYGIRMYINYGA